MMEYCLKGGVFEGCAVYVSGYPVVVEYWGALSIIKSVINNGEEEKGMSTHNLLMIHIIRRTSNPRIIPPTLPYQLQKIVDAG